MLWMICNILEHPEPTIPSDDAVRAKQSSLAISSSTSSISLKKFWYVAPLFVYGIVGTGTVSGTISGTCGRGDVGTGLANVAVDGIVR